MKICSKCKRNLELSQFSWRLKSKNVRQSWCKDCFRKRENKLYSESSKERKRKADNRKQVSQQIHEYVWRYLSIHPCLDCGEVDPIVLEFDHRNPDEKLADISSLIKNRASLIRLTEEIEKCDVRCANCHRRRTAKQFGYWTGKNSFT